MTAPAIGRARIPGQRTVDQVDTHEFPQTGPVGGRFVMTDEIRDLLEWADDLLAHPERDMAAADDLATMVGIARKLSEPDLDGQLRADLVAAMASCPPVGTLGDRVADAFLRYAERILTERTGGAW